MRFLFLFGLTFVASCGFTPLYSTTTTPDVCVTSIPEHSGFVLYQILTSRFTGKKDCPYTLTVQTPKFSYSDLGISDHSFTTMQRIQVSAEYTLMDAKHKTLLNTKAKTNGSTSIINDPYASVVARETTEQDVLKNLASQIETHISSFLLKDTQ
ncbi:MAG: hypothetical protein J6Y85_00280 [Alphaproteobacteria bacterium]|nr:hypothetical protein [Alphaproteobacteria bacterium]